MVNELEQTMAALRAERAEYERLAREDPAAHAAKIHTNLPWNHCAMCRLQFKGHGNNAQPLLEDGVVCDECNVNAVRPHRLRASSTGGAEAKGATATRDAAVSKLEAAAEAYLSASVPSIPTLERLHDLEAFYGYPHAIPRRPLPPYCELPLSSVRFEDCMAALYENVKQLK